MVARGRYEAKSLLCAIRWSVIVPRMPPMELSMTDQTD